MPTQNTIARSLHDLGLAGWFGGSLMGAVGLNGATAHLDDPTERARAANAGWDRWTPVNGAAIVAHLLGGAQLVWNNKGRLAVQRKARWVNLAKAGLTAVALGVTAYSRWQGRQLEDTAGDAEVPVRDATTPAPGTPPRAARAQRQLTALQWVVPASTGALVVLNAKAGEQQRPAAIVRSAIRSQIQAWARLAASAASSAAPDVDVPWAKVGGAIIGLMATRRVLRRRRGRVRSGVTTARDIMTSDVITVATTDSVTTAARRLADGDIGSVPVCDGDRLSGMLTDRDIVTRVVANGTDLDSVTAGEIAGRRAVTVDADDPLGEVVTTMARHQIRRLPVVEDGRLVGMISQADVAATGDDDVTGRLVELISADH
ncbi:MAG TPA: CBS domain-containing protein [Euzebyales bacterium]|nr:CBS domain-containing protein [Euzebyales bacterium]